MDVSLRTSDTSFRYLRAPSVQNRIAVLSIWRDSGYPSVCMAMPLAATGWGKDYLKQDALGYMGSQTRVDWYIIVV
jgi:hypothetical protein